MNSVKYDRRVDLADKKLLYESRAKKIYETDSEDQLIQEFNDNVVLRDGEKKGKVKGKASINNTISAHLFEYLESYNILTHYLAKDSEKEMLIKRTEVIPVEVIIRNYVTGDLSKRFDMEEGMLLPAPVSEYYFLESKLKDPMINESHMVALQLCNQEEAYSITKSAFKINAILKAFFERRNITLAEINIRFGKYKGHVIAVDEISPDVCRLWNAETNEKLDIDRFILNLGNVERGYQEIHNRLMGENT